MAEQAQGLWASMMDVARKYLAGQGGPVQAYQPTQQPYVPSHIVAPADASRYGGTQASMEWLRTAEEFAVAVKRLAESVSAADWSIEDSADQPVRRDHPAHKLLEQPNDLMDWSFFVETLVYQLLPAGSYYILTQKSLAGTVMGAWPLRPDRTRPIRGDEPTAPVIAYEHYAEDGVRYVFPPENIIMGKLANPFTPYVGMGATQMMPTTLGMDAASLLYNKNFFEQGGRLSTVIEVEKKMDPDAWKDLQRKLSEAYMGARNAHRVLVLDDKAKLNTTASTASPKEVDFIETRKDISRVIGAMLGVPPIYMGHVSDANLANSYVQDKIFNEQGVKPIMRRLEQGLTKIAASFGQLHFKFKRAEVMDPQVASTLATAGFNAGAFSPNDVREKLGSDRVKGDPNMDARFVPVSAVPLADAMVPLDMAPEAGWKPAAPAGAPAAPVAPAKPSAASNLTPVKPLASKAVKANRGTATQQRVLRWAIQQRPKTERRYLKAVRRWLLAVGEEAAKAVEAQAKGGAWKRTEMLATVAKAMDPASKELVATLAPVVEGELMAYNMSLSTLFGVPEDAQTFQPGTGAFAQATTQLAQRVTMVSDSVQRGLDQLIREGMELGLSPYEIANGTADGSFAGIRDTFQGFAQERAQLIARTETVALQDQAAVAAYKDMGLKTLDVIGCEDTEIMPGQTYGCNSVGIPIAVASSVQFHPNHRGALVPGEAVLSPAEMAATLALTLGPR